jgi:hypothetical protein
MFESKTNLVHVDNPGKIFSGELDGFLDGLPDKPLEPIAPPPKCGHGSAFNRPGRCMSKGCKYSVYAK